MAFYVIVIFRFEEIFTKAFLSKIKHSILRCIMLHSSQQMYARIIVKDLVVEETANFSSTHSDKCLFYFECFFTCYELSCMLPLTLVYSKQKTFLFKRKFVVKCQKEYRLNNILSLLAKYFSRELAISNQLLSQ